MSVAARYEAAKSFDLEDDLEFCPVLTIEEVLPHFCFLKIDFTVVGEERLTSWCW